MHDETHDRRIQRTRRLLRGALVELVKERGYDTITIQDITERANLGRTTFYLHYQSKEELLLDHHAEMTAHFNITALSRDQLLSDTPQPEVIEFLNLLADNRPMYHAIRAAKDAGLLLRGIQEQLTTNMQNSLKAIFPDAEPQMPMDVLTAYIVGAQLSLIQWWMTHRTPYDALQLAAMLHRFQRVAICDAYQLS
ncbi:MAG: TetR/AcrR family transcriptional regulator [Anaerolineae bacterium]|nr:TetR/AcrR family transcriptional regulator [Anaerolineae bacterium]